MSVGWYKINQAVRAPKLPMGYAFFTVVIQYITVSGGTCNMLSVLWQSTGQICFIKVPENDSNRVWVLLFCVCDQIRESL